MAERPKTRGWMRVLLAVLPSLLLLGMLEIGGRLAGFRPETWSALDDRLGYRMAEPSQRFPIEAERADVLLLGDSITYPGYPVAETKQSFADLLAGKGYEVINLSGIGYGTDQQLLLLERHLDELPPVDTVVVNFCLFNDFIDNANEVNPHDGFRPKPYFELVDGELIYRGDHLDFSGVDRFSLWVRQRSGAVFLLRRLLGMDRKQGEINASAPVDPRRYRVRLTGGAPDRETYDAYLEKVRSGMAVTRALLQRIDTLAREQLDAKKVAILLHPHGYRTEGTPLYALEPDVETLFSELGNSIDMGCYYDRSPRLVPAYDRVGHLTVDGHAAVADMIQGIKNHGPASALLAPGGECALHRRFEPESIEDPVTTPDPE